MYRSFCQIALVLAVAGLAVTVVHAGDGHPVATPYQPAGALPEPSWCLDAPDRVRQVDPMLSATEHILLQQCDNGGFGWPHDNCAATEHNITGPILLGVLGAHAHSRDPYHLLGAVNGGVFAMTSRYDNGEARFASFTPYFLMRLSAASGNTSFEDFAVTDFFDELSAGTYGPNDHDTAGLIAAIEAARTGVWVNLRPWDLQTLVPSARELGHTGQDLLFEEGVLDGLDTLDNSDPAAAYSDILGLAGAVRALAFAGRYSFPPVVAPLHTGVDGIDTTEALAAHLASLQNPDGSWNWHSNLADPGEGDQDVQTTAYAVLALLEADVMTAASHDAACRAGHDWLVSMVNPDGGIPSYPGGDENTEVEGEAVEAMAAVRARIFVDGFEAGTLDLWDAVAP